MSRSSTLVCSLALCLACAGVARAGAQGPRQVSAHLEGGLGGDGVRPMADERTGAAMASAGVGVVVLPRVRLTVEGTASGGGDFAAAYIPEGARPGTRTLNTVLVGVELSGEHALGAPYLSAGVGSGRMTLKDAKNGDMWMYPPSPPLPRDQDGLAIGGGLGYRFTGGPYATGWQLGVRTHTLWHARALVAWATCGTVGLAY